MLICAAAEYTSVADDMDSADQQGQTSVMTCLIHIIRLPEIFIMAYFERNPRGTRS